MPLTSKGEEIMHNMEKTYGSEKKAEQVFYASKNAGTISGVDVFGDAMLSFGGGFPVASPTGPGDVPISPSASEASGNIVHTTDDAGRLGHIAFDYLGKDVMSVDAKTFGKDDGLLELKKELNKFLSEEEKESEHKGGDSWEKRRAKGKE